MAINIFGGRANVLIGLVSATIESIGFDDTNVIQIFEVGNSLKSWIPGRPFNPLTTISPDKGYYIYAKIDMDLTDYFAPPTEETIIAYYTGIAVPATDPPNDNTTQRWLCQTAGTYTNFKDISNVALVVSSGDIENGYVEFWGKSDVFSKHVFELPTSDSARFSFPDGKEPILYLEKPDDNFSATELNIINGIKAVSIVNPVYNKRYYIVTFFTSTTGSFPWRIQIRDLNDSGTSIAISDAVPTNTNGLSLMVLSGTGGETFYLWIDYSVITPNTELLNSTSSKLVFNKGTYAVADYNKMSNRPTTLPGDSVAIVASNQSNKITVNTTGTWPTVTIPANVAFIAARFNNGTYRYFSIAAGTYSFTANFQTMGIDLTATPPADNGTVPLVIKTAYGANDQMNPTRFIEVANIWNGKNPYFAPKFAPLVQQASTGLVNKTTEQVLVGNPQIIEPFAFYNIASTISAGVAEQELSNYPGFNGRVRKLTVPTSGYVRLFEKSGFKPDLTQSLFVEFDYKIESGSFNIQPFFLPWTNVGYHGAISLVADGSIRRKRFEITAAQLGTIPAGSQYADYFNAISSGVIVVGNIKMWQGGEIVDMTGEGDVKTSEALRINEGILDTIKTVPTTQTRISVAGSSVPFGEGFLQTSYVKELILSKQKGEASVISPDSLIALNAASSTMLTGTSNRKYFDRKALKIEGLNAELNFTVYGDEVSIVQGIERSNLNASEINVYIDGTLYDTINNWNNKPIGSGTKNFVGDGIATKFDLGRCFTYNHAVTVNAIAKTGTLYQGGYGGTFPVGADYMVIRKYGADVNGNPEVHHYLYFVTAPANGLAIVANFDYGEDLCYEKTTIGKTAAGVLESAFGDGDVSYDTTNPSALSSGLDFRQTNEKVVKTYRFGTIATRAVKLKIKGNYNGASGTPYFIFNFATNRFFHFQNAGIGGWKLANFNSNVYYNLNYRNIVSFAPDVLHFECSNNEDWQVHGHKLYSTASGLSLTQIRALRNTMPAKSVTYDSGGDTYTYQKFAGKIEAITDRTVKFVSDATHGYTSAPAVGDLVFVGRYFNSNKEYAVRFIKSYDDATKTITFDKPVYAHHTSFDSIQDMVGMEVRVRDLSVFTNDLETFVNNIRNAHPAVEISVLCNPLPNISTRELWGYWEAIGKKADAMRFKNVRITPIQDYQLSQRQDANSVTIDAATLLTDTATGYQYAELSTLAATNNFLNAKIEVGGINVAGRDAFIDNAYTYVFNQSLTGTGLNMDATLVNGSVSEKQVNSGTKARLIFIKNAPISGDINIVFCTKRWSADSTHIDDNSDAAKLFAGMCKDAIK